MSNYSIEEKNKLFTLVRTLLGKPKIEELSNDDLCNLLDISIQDYTQRVQNWLITTNWTNVFGKQISALDMTFALSTRSLDYDKQFSYAVSKQVGLQQNGPWELQKDYIILERGKQVYEIPAGRELNEVLWLTPPVVDAGILANFGGFSPITAFGDVAFGGSGLNSTGMDGFGGPLVNSYDILARAQDYNLKNRIFRSELMYKVTAGPNGTKLLHLLSTPGMRYNFSGNYNPGFSQGNSLGVVGAFVWYYYYDTDQTKGKTAEECRTLNKDVILTPDQIEFGQVDYTQFNDSTKTFIRQLLVAEAKMFLGKIRGRFSGSIKIKDAEITLDYQMFLEEGRTEKETTLSNIDSMLDYLRPEKQLELEATKAMNLNNVLKYMPMSPFYVR